MGKNEKTGRKNEGYDNNRLIHEKRSAKSNINSVSEKSQRDLDKRLTNKLMNIRDVNSKDIFKNNTLASQFLRDYTGIEFFSDVQPEDIEDQTTWFQLMMGLEVQADTLKKVHVNIGDKQEEIYVLSLIEHKSRVDADVSMQLLKSMASIWIEYRKKYDERHANASKAKSFRYPLIIPIVYYEGEEEWTIGRRLSERIAHADLASEYIPDFEYKIIRLHQYDDEDLKAHNNEMSLIMMINKIQNKDDFHEFQTTALEYMKSVFSSTSEEMQDLILTVTWGLLMKMKVEEEKARDLITKVKEGKDMGILFENFKEFDWKGAQEEIKEVRVKIEEEKAKVEAERAKAEEERARVEEERARADKAEAELQEAKALIAELQKKVSSRQ